MKPSRTVLIVEDEANMRRVLGALLERDGFQTIEASDGGAALERLAREPVDAILTDLRMPRMNGLELLRKIREDSKLHDTIVFVLTTSNDEKDKFDAYNLNVAGYMLKSDMGNSFVRAVSLVENYWKVIEFPGNRPAQNGQ